MKEIGSLLNGIPDFDVVTATAQTDDIVQTLGAEKPHLALIDFDLLSDDGIKELNSLRLSQPELAIALVVSERKKTLLSPSLMAYVSVCLSRQFDSRDLEHVVKCALSGKVVVSPQFSDVLFGTVPTQEPTDEPEPRIQLTPRELEVLEHLVQGQTNSKIAEALGLSQVTIKKHVQSILWKLKVQDRLQAALMGIKLGLVK